jgi:hypothetical protein
MWSAFEAGGSSAAIALGPSLNLSPSTIKNWARGWEREVERGGAIPEAKAKKVKDSSAPVKGSAEPAKPKLPKRIKGYKFNPTGKRRVMVSYLPHRQGWLVTEGPCVSEIRWDDDFGQIYFVNKFIKDAPQKKARKIEPQEI